jgi:hypothetical protein
MDEDNKQITRPYTHTLQEVGGSHVWYHLVLEERISHKGCEYLYSIGVGHLDSFCGGNAGGKYVVVPGRVVRWKSNTNDLYDSV